MTEEAEDEKQVQLELQRNYQARQTNACPCCSKSRVHETNITNLTIRTLSVTSWNHNVNKQTQNIIPKTKTAALLYYPSFVVRGTCMRAWRVGPASRASFVSDIRGLPGQVRGHTPSVRCTEAWGEHEEAHSVFNHEMK